MIKEFLFSWINKPQYLLTMVDYTKAIMEMFAVLVGAYGIARLIEKLIKKMKRASKRKH